MKIPGLILVCTLALPLAADEGMWLFNQFPKDAVKKAYNFDVTDQFLDNLRLATVRIGNNSGAVVSANGLMLTDRDTVADCIAKASSAPHDYAKDGFYAAAQSDELACPGLVASVVVALEDVTDKVKEGPAKETPKNAKAAAAAEAEAMEKRAAAIARIEKDCAEKTGNTCVVVKLSSGERYDLYQYQTFSDLRLVFAPELTMATFGGDASIFKYQRYELEAAFLRAYREGKPAPTPHFLKWGTDGLKDSDLLFVAGSPGATNRLDTASQLTFYHDVALPITDKLLAERIDGLRRFTPNNPDQRQIAEKAFSALGMAFKFDAGLYIGLNDERIMIRKVNFEKRLRSAVEHDPKLGVEAGKMWDDLSAAYKSWSPFERSYQLLETPGPQGSTLLTIARQIVRISEERAKPNDQRLPGYRDSQLPALEASLFAPAPIDPAVEVNVLTTYLTELKALSKGELAGGNQAADEGGRGGRGGGRMGGGRGGPMQEETVTPKGLFTNKTPAQMADEFVKGSKLADVAERKRLAADKAAMTASDDTMIKLARMLDDPARKLIRKRQEAIDTLAASASEKIAMYRFRIFGPADYPDATSTLRISYGLVKPYQDRTEASVLSATTFGGMFFFAGDQAPFKLPQRWIDAKQSLDLVVPFDFVSTCDTSTGSSGSPTVNQKGELVGMVFDANLEALPSTYMYSDEVARAVHVSAQGIVEALRKIYKTPALLKELGIPESKSGTE